MGRVGGWTSPFAHVCVAIVMNCAVWLVGVFEDIPFFAPAQLHLISLAWLISFCLYRNRSFVTLWD